MKNYKPVLAILLVAVSTGIAGLPNARAGDVPTSMNFQGRLTDAAGNPINGSRSVVFSIWDAASGGNQLWTETQTVSVSSGIYNTGLGSLLALSTAVFSTNQTWLQLQVGADAAMTPRISFRSSAYSMWAQMATGLLTKLPFNDLFNISQMRVNITDSPGYTVPAGKNFIAYDVQRKVCVLDPVNDCTTYPGPPASTFCTQNRCHIKVTGAHTGTNVVMGKPESVPFILGPGDIITSTSSNISLGIQGVLIPNNVTVVLQDIAPSGNYTNATADLYFGLIAPKRVCPGTVSIGSYVWQGSGAGGQLPAGQTLTNNTSCTLTLNGYLK